MLEKKFLKSIKGFFSLGDSSTSSDLKRVNTIEDYVKLVSDDEPVKESEFSDLNFVSKMVELGLAVKNNEFYMRTKKGEYHYNNVLQEATDDFESKMNSN